MVRAPGHDPGPRTRRSCSSCASRSHGELIPADEWQRRQGEWLPTDVDKTHVRSLMQPVHERGKIAAWIAPPRNGINGQPFDYDYVHLS